VPSLRPTLACYVRPRHSAENLKRNVDVMRSAEDERIAMAKLEQEEDDARRDGVLLKARDRD
jgi:hypothetical protein